MLYSPSLWNKWTNNSSLSFQLEPFQQLPPPSLLKRKIIIKNKKKHHHHKKTNAAPPPPVAAAAETETPAAPVNESPKNSVGEPKIHPSPIRQGSKDSSQENDEDDGESFFMYFRKVYIM